MIYGLHKSLINLRTHRKNYLTNDDARKRLPLKTRSVNKAVVREVQLAIARHGKFGYFSVCVDDIRMVLFTTVLRE